MIRGLLNHNQNVIDMKARKIYWDKTFAIGQKPIDEDHIQILKIYNDLIDIAQGVGNFDEFARVLSDMTTYALKHFEKEEAYMSKMNYPNIESHIEFHRHYIYKVAMFNIHYRIDTEIDEVLEFIHNWWVHHIQKTDMEYENYKLENYIQIDF